MTDIFIEFTANCNHQNAILNHERVQIRRELVRGRYNSIDYLISEIRFKEKGADILLVDLLNSMRLMCHNRCIRSQMFCLLCGGGVVYLLIK